jgi:hypothetical protein
LQRGCGDQSIYVADQAGTLRLAHGSSQRRITPQDRIAEMVGSHLTQEITELSLSPSIVSESLKELDNLAVYEYARACPTVDDPRPRERHGPWASTEIRGQDTSIE